MELVRYFKPFLLVLTLAHLANWGMTTLDRLLTSKDLLLADGTPVAGDFINLHSAGLLTVAGNIPAIYDPEAFMAFERTVIDAFIGLRLWAYPPHSLLAAWPFGLMDFYVGLAVFSVLGLVVLGLGARRLGFDWMETTIIVLSPAALNCLHFGQTGNLVTGLLLLALSAKQPRDLLSAASAAVLTMKPQTGFLLALLWLINSRWWMIVVTSALAVALVALTLLLFGPDAWRDYAGLTLPLLSGLEKHGSGPFMLMIPSLFMSLRVFGLDGDPALYIHLAFAAVVIVILAFGLRRSRAPLPQAAMLMLGTALATPYLHSYDLAMLLAGALLVARRDDSGLSNVGRLLVLLLVVIAWGLPNMIFVLNAMGAPVSPIIIGALFAVALIPQRR